MIGPARGTFEVKLIPDGDEDKAQHVVLGRLAIHKEFHGDLEGSSRGAMLTAQTDTPGSAAYVALERVTGTLHGRHGAFALMHSGTMNRGAQHLGIQVVPDSGSGQLTGLVGEMTIEVEDGEHSYEFVYTLPSSP